jgi:hypothetical protein
MQCFLNSYLIVVLIFSQCSHFKVSTSSKTINFLEVFCFCYCRWEVGDNQTECRLTPELSYYTVEIIIFFRGLDSYTKDDTPTSHLGLSYVKNKITTY